MALSAFAASTFIEAAPNPWDDASAQFQGIGMDGNFERSFALGTLALGSGDGIPFTLRHEVHEIYGESVESRWEVPELCTYVEPYPGGGWYWKSPGRSRRIFRADGSCRATTSGTVSGWMLWRENYDDVVISSDSGYAFRYHCHSLVEVDHGEDRLTVVARGAWIQSVPGTNGLNVTYDTFGRVESLSIGHETHQFTYYPGTLSLRRWSRVADGATTTFGYDDGLLTKIESSRGTEAIRWRRVSENIDRRISNYVFPVSLAEDGLATYNYSVGESGVLIDLVLKTGHRHESLLYNPLLGRVRHIDENGIAETYTTRGKIEPPTALSP